MNTAILVSPGELVDKITIMEIKRLRVTDKSKLASINEDLAMLRISMNSLLSGNTGKRKSLLRLKSSLRIVNLKLWNIENAIRQMEAKKDFGAPFIKKAREVYFNNDKRSIIKNKINKLFGSTINEVKQYTRYK